MSSLNSASFIAGQAGARRAQSRIQMHRGFALTKFRPGRVATMTNSIAQSCAMNVVGWVDAALVQPLGLPSWTAWLVLVVLTIAVVNFVTRMLDSGAWPRPAACRLLTAAARRRRRSAPRPQVRAPAGRSGACAATRSFSRGPLAPARRPRSSRCAADTSPCCCRRGRRRDGGPCAGDARHDARNRDVHDRERGHRRAALREGVAAAGQAAARGRLPGAPSPARVRAPARVRLSLRASASRSLASARHAAT